MIHDNLSELYGLWSKKLKGHSDYCDRMDGHAKKSAQMNNDMEYFQEKMKQIEDEKMPVVEMDLENNYIPKVKDITGRIESLVLESFNISNNLVIKVYLDNFKQ